MQEIQLRNSETGKLHKFMGELLAEKIVFMPNRKGAICLYAAHNPEGIFDRPNYLFALETKADEFEIVELPDYFQVQKYVEAAISGELQSQPHHRHPLQSHGLDLLFQASAKDVELFRPVRLGIPHNSIFST